MINGLGVGLDFSTPVYNVDEDGMIDICMDLTGIPSEGLECDIVVPLSLVNGRAGELVRDKICV